jgi:hypothetical protein
MVAIATMIIQRGQNRKGYRVVACYITLPRDTGPLIERRHSVMKQHSRKAKVYA